jgi:hypothetical protein
MMSVPGCSPARARSCMVALSSGSASSPSCSQSLPANHRPVPGGTEQGLEDTDKICANRR